jgi:hypothetical protein
MHTLPNVDEIERYITERLLIAGTDQPNIFTPGAIDFIFQCSEGIPRQINNLCDNAMLTAYAAGEQIIGRQIIEEVADNLDLLPRRDSLLANEKALDAAPSGSVLTTEAREELWSAQKYAEQPKPRTFQTENPPVNGNLNGNSNGNSNGRRPSSDSSDDDISLEIGGFY